jgi:hypothetical protein
MDQPGYIFKFEIVGA